MQRIVVKSKIHRATVTRADLDYEGSCSIDRELLRLADIVPGEQVHVLNLANGERAVTYAIEGESGEIGLNGAIAHLGKAGDLVILLSYAQYEDAELRGQAPRIVLVDAANRPRTEALTP
ncbi:MAG: aspartate 1-decarboxylase [Candidatus Dormibacteria bacterium]